MNVRLTLRVLGGLLYFLAAMLLTPVPFSIYYRDGVLLSFLLSAGVSAAVGAFLYFKFPTQEELTHREGFAIVTFGWIVFSIFGALPYLFSRTIGNPVDAFFESMSGFTTTGATVIGNLDLIPHSILFWRSTTQWLGGMGIIVLSMAILPFLGVGGMQLFEAEVPGPTADRLTPRVQDTAKVLWGVYFIMTLCEVVLLWIGEMSFFEAVNHSFTTMATGGFSTRDESLGAFESSYIHFVITIFMFLSGVNFSLHFYVLRGRFRQYWKSDEFRFYLTIVVASSLFIAVCRFRDAPVSVNIRDSFFQTVSFLTSTGFATADYEEWPVVTQYLLVTLMFIGGCAGSTGGGMKVVRILLVVRHAFLQVSRLIHPREVRLLRLDHVPVSAEVMQSILGFVALFVGIFLHASLVMAALGLDLVTASATVIACLANIGPCLGDIGPTENYAAVPMVGKLILAACMLIGRLELFTVLVLFFPSFWKK